MKNSLIKKDVKLQCVIKQQLLLQLDSSAAAVAEAWQDPDTEELEAVVQLVCNCQSRIDYEAVCRQSRRELPGETKEMAAYNSNDSSNDENDLDPMDIPPLGVPLRYAYNYSSLPASESFFRSYLKFESAV